MTSPAHPLSLTLSFDPDALHESSRRSSRGQDVVTYSGGNLQVAARRKTNPTNDEVYWTIMVNGTYRHPRSTFSIGSTVLHQAEFDLETAKEIAREILVVEISQSA